MLKTKNLNFIMFLAWPTATNMKKILRKNKILKISLQIVHFACSMQIRQNVQYKQVQQVMKEKCFKND